MLCHCNRIRGERGKDYVLDIEEDGCHSHRVEHAWPGLGEDPRIVRRQGAVTILVATVRQSLVRAFQRAAVVMGLALVVSPDGLHTLMSAVREPPALIILDSDVPGVEADAIQRRLARDVRTARVPILRLPGGSPDDRADRLPGGHAA
jgi:hypothetical protein